MREGSRQPLQRVRSPLGASRLREKIPMLSSSFPAYRGDATEHQDAPRGQDDSIEPPKTAITLKNVRSLHPRCALKASNPSCPECHQAARMPRGQ
jgi:hypothetical protein